MLIIFDLDDTLVDTSAHITPFKLRSAFLKMQEVGAKMGEGAFSRLLALNEQASSGKAALALFVKEFLLEDFILEVGVQELYGSLSEDVPIYPVSGALEVLSQLKKEFSLAIVSIGKKEQQLHKLKKAGIDFSFFYKILCIEEGSKRSSYEELLKEQNVLPSQVVVCGDKIAVDLIPAKELGCGTVHMKKGRGIYDTSPAHFVDFAIAQLPELPGILSLMKKNTI